MMSAWGEMGQRPKKKIATYGKTPSKLRSQNATASKSTGDATTESSKPATHAPVKDIYDYDFVDDDVAPVAKTPAKPKTPYAARTAPRPTPTKSAATASPASHQSKSAASAPRSAVRHAVDSTRGIKRKPSQIDLTAGELAGKNTSAGPSANRTNNGQSKKKQRPSPSPDPFETATTTPLGRHARTSGRDVGPVSSSLGGSLSRQRAPNTPPRDLATPRAPATARAPSASPGKARSSTIAAIPSSRKQQPSQAASLMPIRQGGSQAAKPSPQQTQPRPAIPPPRPLQTPRPDQRKRRRLIDALVAQKEEESSSDEEENVTKTGDGGEDEDSSQADTVLSRPRYAWSTPASEGRSPYRDVDSLATMSPGKVSLAPSTPATITRRTTTRRPNIKFTYNLERTMLAEEPIVLGGPAGSDLSLLESLLPEPEPKPSAFDMDDDMGGSSSQGAIQSIHELRQAGANSRFADELVDIMDRVGKPSTGKPSSARRSALMEMAQKLQDKSFVRHFRDQGGEMQLFREAGKETDVVAGFTITCIAITLLANGSASHRLLRELRQEKASNLFATLLKSDVDIVALARDRKTNVSNYGRQVLGSLKATLLKLPIWKPAPEAPSQLPPRTAALKALRLFAEQEQAMTGDDDGVLSAPLTKQLFSIVSSGLPSAYDDIENDVEDAEDASPAPPLLLSGLSKDAESVDLHLALSLLEMHSVSAMQSDIGAEWTRDYIPIIADALDASLQQHQKLGQRLNDLELLVLKLAMNTANNNPEAARYYVEKGLLRMLAELSCGVFAAIVRSVNAGEDFAADALDELLLMLGVMINFSENDVSAGETLVQSGGSVLIDQLGKVFLDGRSIAAEADSEEKSQLIVAFAYLSILLGYLCLYEPIFQAFKKLSPSRSLKPLLDSIHQFIMVHDQLGKSGTDTEQGADENHFTARLRALAQELEVRA